MNSTTETLHTEIYPALFHMLPSALPEFEFIQAGKNYRSGNTLKITGENDGDGKGKVYVYHDKPGYIKDYRIGSMSIWDYIKERDGLTENRDVMKRLAQLAGYSLPEQQLSPEALERIQQAQQVGNAWEVANDFFIECLSGLENEHSSSTRAYRVQQYLTNPLESGGRGYSPGLFKLSGQQQDRDSPKMELGYIPGVPDVKYCLQDAGFSSDTIDIVINSILKAGPRIGVENVLTFPYRDHAGRIKGMVFRAVEKGSEPKYLYSEFKRSEILFNLRAVAGDKDLVIVESPLDALHAAALGITNVTALGGSGDTLNKTQVDLAIKYGASRITLMLDNDSEDGIERAGIKGTDKAVAFLLREYANVEVFVGHFPESVKDLDDLLVVYGTDGFTRTKSHALPAWQYLHDRLIDKYERLQNTNPEKKLLDKQLYDLEHDVLSAAEMLPKKEGDKFLNAFLNLEGAELGITRETLEEIADQRRAKINQQKQDKATKELLTEADRLLTKGNGFDALKRLQERSRDIVRMNQADEFVGLFEVVSEADLTARLKLKPNDLSTGYTIDGQELLLPAGAISIIAAPTSHGKTTLLTNLSLRVADRHRDKSVYFLSYEEDGDSVLISAMNTYIAANLSGNNRKSIRSFYRDESNEYTRREMRDTFDAGRTKFFSELINTRRLNIHYVDYDSDSLCDAIRLLHKKGNAGAVFIDYMQLLHKGQQGKNKYHSRQEEIKQICIDLKDVAVETGLPITLGAQFNREVVNPARLHPTKIGEAGDIERIANLILGFWNNNMKILAGEDEAEALSSYHSRRDHIYVELLKYRGGKPGLAEMLSFDGNTGLIENASQAIYSSASAVKTNF